MKMKKNRTKNSNYMLGMTMQNSKVQVKFGKAAMNYTIR